jgi:hypothetical protein
MSLILLLNSLAFRGEIDDTELLLVNFPFVSTAYWRIPLSIDMKETHHVNGRTLTKS